MKFEENKWKYMKYIKKLKTYEAVAQAPSNSEKAKKGRKL